MTVQEAQADFVRTLYRAAALGLILGGVLYAWRAAVGGGFMLGCGAGVAAYLWLARQLPKVSALPPQEQMIYSVRQAVARMGLYAIIFALAYRLDRATNTGIAGALGGYLWVRLMLTISAWGKVRPKD